jgi:hypothetical protein
MFGFSPKLPVSDEQRIWTEQGFKRLEKLLGRHRMLDAKVVEPTAEDFPDPYKKFAESCGKAFLSSLRLYAHRSQQDRT